MAALNASADAMLGAAVGGITLSGGGLQYGAAFDSARAVAVNRTGGGGTIDTNGFFSTLSGDITGAGRFSKTGFVRVSSDANLGGAISCSEALAKAGLGRLDITGVQRRLLGPHGDRRRRPDDARR